LRSRSLRSSRRLLAARWALFATAALFALHVAGRAALASAIAHAPNRPLSHPPAQDVAPPRVSESLRVRVGPPAALLSAWVLEPTGGLAPRGTVVVLHGVRLDKRSMLPAATALADAGFRAVLVDLRGHGRSSGDHLTYGVVESRDISQLLDALEARGMVLGPVGVHGFSYGAATAIHVAADDSRVRAVVAVSAFASLRGVVRDYLRHYVPELEPAVPRFWLDGAIDLGGRMARFDPDAAAPTRAARRLRASMLVLHGARDTQVPPHHAEILAKAAQGRATTLLLAEQTHESMLADENRAVMNAALRWFSRELVPVGARRPEKI
jgi:pimeloyl-ACP methyl ester carboxylesterase